MGGDDVCWKCPNCQHYYQPVRCADCNRATYYSDAGTVECPTHGMRETFVCDECDYRMPI